MKETYGHMQASVKIVFLLTLAIALCTMLCITSIAYANPAGSAEFAGGTGTEADPYIVETKQQLNAVRNDMSASYKLNADIVFTEADFAEGGEFYNDGKGWEPINTFRGNFDGAGHVIKKIVINANGIDVGFFGECNDAKIMNLGIVEGKIIGGHHTGGIAAEFSGGKIERCYYTGTINSYTRAGGIVGRMFSGELSNCYNTGEISGSSSGGIVGEMSSGEISNCYNTCEISGYASAGIIGEMSSGEISNCYNIGSITNNSSSHSSGEIVGRNEKGSITNCYYIEDKLPGVGVGEDTATACSPEAFAEQVTFSGFDFENVWVMGSGDYKFPTLRGLPNDVTFGRIENFTDFAGGYGIKSSPYIIETPQQLNNVRSYLDASFKLANDITFIFDDFEANGAFYNDGKGWEPIGDSKNPFTGSLDGAGHVIRGLKSIRTDSSDVGLFGYSNGSMKHLGMVNSAFEASSAGGICGTNRGEISACYNTGAVTAAYAGGIAQYNEGMIKDCYNSGSIGPGRNSYGQSGGIVGDNRGRVINCYNIGVVMHRYQRGGIAGVCSTDAAIQDCYYLNYGYQACGDCDEDHGALSLTQMQLQASYVGFDFENTWVMRSNSVYRLPMLRTVTNYARTPIENTTDFAGGYGTYDDPYLIKTKAQLNQIRKYLYASYRLENDIIFTSADFSKKGDFYNEGKRWEPIGTFLGNLDGNGHDIKGIVIERQDEDNVGLFSSNYGEIKALKIADFNMSTRYDNCGGITANNYGTIVGCSNDGSFHGSGGVFCGRNYGTISGCFNLGNIESVVSIAAIASRNGGTIAQCYNSGQITTTGSYNAAGITVYNSGTIRDCYNTGDIAAGSYAGGITVVGYNSKITNCYNIGIVKSREHTYTETGEKKYKTGGIIGSYERSAKIFNCYYLDASGDYDESEAYGTKSTIHKMKERSTYKGFDFTDVWEMREDGSYTLPTLRGVVNYAAEPEENTTDFAGGYGTKSSPYIIKNQTQLQHVREKLNACYKLGADISFTAADFAAGGAFYNEGQGWEPIGDADHMFIGTFNGNGHIITGIQIKRNNLPNIGLFGASSGTIQNLKMKNSSIRGKTKVGSIVGYNCTGKIEGCSSNGTITSYVSSSDNRSDYAYAGGITGYSSGYISTCANTASVRSGHCESRAYAGGIAGYSNGWMHTSNNAGKITDLSSSEAYEAAEIGGLAGVNSGTISMCYNTGQVQGTNAEQIEAGGIAGENERTITNSYNLGNVTAKYSVGGIAGISSGRIHSCYNAGRIEGLSYKQYDDYSETYVGGIVGDNGWGSDSPSDCYNLGIVTAKYGNAGGIAGKSSKAFGGCYNVGSVTCTSGNAGGIVGKSAEPISGCYYLDNMDKGIGSGYGTTTKCTAAEMRQAQTYGDTFDFDYDMIWEIAEAADYPFPILTEVVNPELQYTLSLESRQRMPEPPTVVSYGNGTITINTISGQKYICLCDGEKPSLSSTAWKTASNRTMRFENLEQGKIYKIYTYIPASGSQSASYISLPLEITLKTLGDLDGDGKIHAADVLYLKRALAGWEGYELNFSASNTNGDDKLDQADAMVLERHIAGWKGYKSLPVIGKTA